MHDIRAIRANPDQYDAAWALRYVGVHASGASWSSVILELDEKLRAAVSARQVAERTRNESSKLIGKAKAAGNEDAFTRLRDEVAKAKLDIETQSTLENRLRADLEAILVSLPNRPVDGVPEGEDETANRELRQSGDIPSFTFAPKAHDELGENLGLMDFETAANMSGARFVVLSGALARLERALAAFMLDMHTQQHGYSEVSPPLLVQDQALFGTGQLPKFAEDSFRAGDKHWIIPTAEVPLTNMVAGKILEIEQLPLRYTAHSPCFRSEAGAAGRDTKGMIRLHQFYKVELVTITTPQASDAELERMTECAENILKALELPYRVMLLSSGDMGFGAAKTYDLEVWLPSQNTYREISSCSNCRDFQARRMNTRFRDGKKRDIEFAHTLNGSGLAVGRTLLAVMENYQKADGSIAIPPALIPYMGGIEQIG